VTGITRKIIPSSAKPSLPLTPLNSKKNRPGKNQRLRIKKARELQNLQQRYPLAPLHNLQAINTPAWQNRPDWEDQHHCDVCHQNDANGHWLCSPFPGLNKDTCRKCADTAFLDVYHVNPWLSLVENPLLIALSPIARSIRNFYQDYNQFEYYRGKVVDLLLLLVALLLVKLV